MSGFAIDPVEATVGQNQQPNALGQIGQIASTIGQLQQNRLFPLQQQGMQLQNQTVQQNLQNTYAQNWNKVISSVPPGSPPDAYVAAAARYAGALYPQDYAEQRTGNTDWNTLAREGAIQSESGTAMTAQFGAPVSNQTGTGTQMGVQNPVTNTYEPAGGPTSGFVPNAALANTPVYHRYNQETQQDEIVTAGAAAANPANPKGIPAGAPIGTEAGVTGNIQQGLGIQGGIINAALDSQNRRAALGTVIGLSKNLSTGPNADFWKGLGEWASEYGLDLKGLGINEAPGVTAAREALDKLGWQVAQRQFQVLGGTGSNQQLQSAVSTSPHSSLSAEGIQNIAGFLQGNEDAIQAEARALQKWNAMPQHAGRPQSVVNFPNTWNQIYDPRAFQFKYEDADGQNAIMNGMSAKEKADFQRRQKLMTDMGYLQ